MDYFHKSIGGVRLHQKAAIHLVGDLKVILGTLNNLWSWLRRLGQEEEVRDTGQQN